MQSLVLLTFFSKVIEEKPLGDWLDAPLGKGRINPILVFLMLHQNRFVTEPVLNSGTRLRSLKYKTSPAVIPNQLQGIVNL